MPAYKDIAIPLAWPDKTAFGDERWMSWLKKIGIVKNLNFKVGHAAVLLIEHATGDIKYFDFGRYVTPRGYGRARSERFDPRLCIETKAVIAPFGRKIENLEAILAELSQIEEFTHGEGPLLFSLAHDIDFQLAFKYASDMVERGPVPYGAIAARNNSCSRYVAQTLVAGMVARDPRIRKLYYPESLKSSPTSNVVNGSEDNTVFWYKNGRLEEWRMSRLASLRFQWRLLQDNLSREKSTLLASDEVPPLLREPKRPFFLPQTAQWLGGIGEGMWFNLTTQNNQVDYQVTAYCQKGREIYTTHVQCIDGPFNPSEPYHFTRKLSGSYFTIIQDDKEFVFRKTDKVAKEKIKIKQQAKAN